jgi:hypothetical protein
MQSKLKQVVNPMLAELRQLREIRGLFGREKGIKAGIDPSSASQAGGGTIGPDCPSVCR